MLNVWIILAARNSDGLDIPYIIAIALFSIVSMIVSAIKKRAEKNKSLPAKPKPSEKIETLEEVRETVPAKGVLAQLIEVIQRAGDLTKPPAGTRPPTATRPPPTARPTEPTRAAPPAAKARSRSGDLEPTGRAVTAHARTFHVSGESYGPRKPQAKTEDVTLSVRQARIAPSEIGAIDPDAKPRRKFRIGSLKQAIVMKEILSPPIALRTDQM
jgi:hypothetical protein